MINFARLSRIIVLLFNKLQVNKMLFAARKTVLEQRFGRLWANVGNLHITQDICYNVWMMDNNYFLTLHGHWANLLNNNSRKCAVAEGCLQKWRHFLVSPKFWRKFRNIILRFNFIPKKTKIRKCIIYNMSLKRQLLNDEDGVENHDKALISLRNLPMVMEKIIKKTTCKAVHSI